MKKPKKFQYKTEDERLDNGLCPNCETPLCKFNHQAGHEDSFDKHPICHNCEWEDFE